LIKYSEGYIYMDIWESSQLVDELTKPTYEKKTDGNYNFPVKPYQRQQADLLFLPTDKKYKYLLVVADVGTRLIDAEPISNKRASTITEAYKRILKREILKLPTLLTVDGGSEFKQDFKEFVQAKGVTLHVAKVGRKQQVSIVERANQSIGKYLNKIMLNQELITGRKNTSWVQYVRPLIIILNAKRKRDPTPPDLEKQFDNMQPIKCPKSGCVLMDLDQPVRVKLEYPINSITGQKLGDKFRTGDIRFSPQVYKISGIRLYENSPPLYYIKELNTLYTKDELKPTTYKKADDEYYPLRIRNEKRDKYLIEWKDYPNVKDWTFEDKKQIKQDFPIMVKNWLEFKNR